MTPKSKILVSLVALGGLLFTEASFAQRNPDRRDRDNGRIDRGRDNIDRGRRGDIRGERRSQILSRRLVLETRELNLSVRRSAHSGLQSERRALRIAQRLVQQARDLSVAVTRFDDNRPVVRQQLREFTQEFQLFVQVAQNSRLSRKVQSDIRDVRMTLQALRFEIRF